MVHFVGAGSGAADLITLRGARLLGEADTVLYAGSLVSPDLLTHCKQGAHILNSATMTLEEVLEAMEQAHVQRHNIVRLHTGDPSVFGAIREQMEGLDRLGIPYDIVPGVSSVFGAAAALKVELTVPGVSQTVILTRMEGRTPVPERERIRLLAAHRATMAIFLSAGMLETLVEELVQGGYDAETPAAIVYKATWPDEKVLRCTISDLPQTAREHDIRKTAMILVGEFLGDTAERSLLYHPSFTTEFREGSGES